MWLELFSLQCAPTVLLDLWLKKTGKILLKYGRVVLGENSLEHLRADKWSVYTSPTTLPIDLHKRCLMAIRNNDIHNGKVWSGLCKLTTYQLLSALMILAKLNAALYLIIARLYVLSGYSNCSSTVYYW